MDEFDSENFYDFNAESNLPDWNEKQWHEYLKKSDNEVLRFASAYTVHKLKGLKLVEIANILGWNFPEDDDEENEDENSADFSDEPWTLLNHPVYIITRALFKNLREYIDNLDKDIKASPEEYERRLALCKECDNLIDGMCKVCGCYVELRAAISNNRCPAVHELW